MKAKKSGVYASSLLNVSPKEKTLKDLKDLVLLLNKEERIKEFFVSPLIPKKEKKSFLKQILSKGELQSFLFVLIDNQAFSFLSEITQDFQELLDEKNKLCRGVIYSPTPLSESLKKELSQKLENFFKKKVELEEKEDKKLIDGFLIEAGGYVFNSSLKYDLEKFKRAGGAS